MKGQHGFQSQTEALKFYTDVVIRAANRGWFRTDAVKELFQGELVNWTADDEQVGAFWGLVCLPILSFFGGVVDGGDSSMRCNFHYDIEVNPSARRLVGTTAWYGIWTPGRFIIVNFDEQGARLEYDTGYEEDGEPKGPSSFLGLPMKSTIASRAGGLST